MARRLSSRLSVAAIVGASIFVYGCGGGGGGTSGGGDDQSDSGAPIDDGSSTDGTAKDSSADSTTPGDSAADSTLVDSTPIDSTPSETSSDTTPPSDTPSDVPTSGCAPPSCGADSDCDGIADSIEGRFNTPSTDTDKDGTPDYLDDDSDGDGILDKLEWVTAGCDSPFAEKNDADGDGVPNFQSLDSDGNGLADHDEACPPKTMPGAPAGCSLAAPADFDGDGWMDFIDFDNDHDSAKASLTLGLDDKTELSDNTKKYVGPTLDADGDKIPDVYDRDSDNDNIFDLEDGTADPDKDVIPNFRDVDSDGDKVPDVCEARANPDFTLSPTEAAKPLLDTNANGIPDYIDLDTDSDFLGDGKEDLNGNCKVDTGETDRLKADTDGDGVPDLPEVTLEGPACAVDPACSPIKNGKFYFIVPYSVDGSAKPTPASGTLALSTSLKKGDVAFIVDTTISMDPEIAALRAGLTTPGTGIIPKLSARFTDLAIGVAAHDDFPSFSISNFNAASRPFYVAPKGAPTGFINKDPAVAQTAANSLVTSSGGDTPESQIAAMMRAINAGTVLSNSDTTAFSLPAETPPAGTFGSLHFRSDALSILIPITDAGFHNGKKATTNAGIPPAGSYDTTFHNAYSSVVTAPNADDLVAAINAIGAKVIGVGADNGFKTISDVTPYGFLAYLADMTSSYVPRAAFGGVTPNCKTGANGSPASADGPAIAGAASCRLVFSVNQDGTGLAQSIVDGVGALLNAISFDVHVRAFKEPTDAIDSVDAFVDSLPPQPTGGTDPVTGGVCVTFPSTALADKYTGPKAPTPPTPDGKNETITGLNPGKLYCFNVVPKPNTTVPTTTSPQTFTAFLQVVADKTGGSSFTLGTDRKVLFIVPPALN